MDLRTIKYTNENLEHDIDCIREFIELINRFSDEADQNFKCKSLRGTYIINGKEFRYSQHYIIDGKEVRGAVLIEKYLKEHFHSKHTMSYYYNVLSRVKNRELLPKELDDEYNKAIRKLNKKVLGFEVSYDKRAMEVLNDLDKLYACKGKTLDFNGIYGTYIFDDLKICFNEKYYNEGSNEECLGKTIISEILKDELDIDYNLFEAIKNVRVNMKNGKYSQKMMTKLGKYKVFANNCNFEQ